MSDSDQRATWKLSTRSGSSQTPGPSQTLDRSPNKLTRLFRGISDSVAPQANPSFSPSSQQDSPIRIEQPVAHVYDPDSRRNAVILDVDPQELRPPSVTDSISTSRFSIVFPPSPPPDTLQYAFKPLIDNSKSEQNISLDSLSRSASKRFLPKFKASLGGPPTRLFSRRRKRRTISYESNGEPLDGEEGELIDDEACFMDSFKTRGMGKTIQSVFLIIT
jgi:hypothetical protein